MIEEAEKVIEVWMTRIGRPLFDVDDNPPTSDVVAELQAFWEQARAGHLAHWQLRDRSMLALIILLDQYPRTLGADERKRTATDRMALALAKKAIQVGMDLKMVPEERQFFYVPLMHSENQTDQDHCVRLCVTRTAQADAILHARARRSVIRKFGRFPHRNSTLGRNCTESERDYLAKGGYHAVLDRISIDSGRR